MKRLILVAAVAIACLAPKAFAQAKNFQGFSITGNWVQTNSGLEVQTKPSVTYGNSTSTNLGLQGQYNWPLGDRLLVGVGAQLLQNDMRVGNLTAIETKFGEETTTTGDVKASSQSLIFVSPGYALSNRHLIYGKLGALSGELQARLGSLTEKRAGTGVGFGIGFQSLLTENIFVQFELLSSVYSDSYKNTQTSIGVGFKF